MITVKIHPGVDAESELSSLEKAARLTVRHEVTEDVDLTVLISDESHLRELNRRFRNVDSETDVLAFPAGEIDPDSGHRYLGDVVISFPAASTQADSAGHSVGAELVLLTVHGVLHLFGYDHDEAQAKTRMWEAQAAILAEMGLHNLEIDD